jgi:DNA transposition AAA+ family ATPase
MSQNATEKRYRIATRDVLAWTRDQGLADTDRSLILYLHNHALDQRLSINGLSAVLKQPGSARSYSPDSVYQAMTGRREPSSLKNFLNSIAEFKKLNEERKSITRAPFIETNLTKKIFSICDTARTMGTVQFIIGESHIGKTTALQEYTRQNNHGRTIFLRIPAGGGMTSTVYRLCTQLKLPNTGTMFARRERIIDYFSDDMVLIVDEAHQIATGDKRSVVTLEFLREIHDISGCGMVISSTPVWENAEKNPALGGIIKQLTNRHLITAKMPKKPTKANLASFAKAFGLKPAQDEALDLQNHVIETSSLGRWLKILQGASRIAYKAETPLTWDHVLQCHATLQKLAGIIG